LSRYTIAKAEARDDRSVASITAIVAANTASSTASRDRRERRHPGGRSDERAPGDRRHQRCADPEQSPRQRRIPSLESPDTQRGQSAELKQEAQRQVGGLDEGHGKVRWWWMSMDGRVAHHRTDRELFSA